jgi:hypothetical protein
MGVTHLERQEDPLLDILSERNSAHRFNDKGKGVVVGVGILERPARASRRRRRQPEHVPLDRVLAVVCVGKVGSAVALGPAALVSEQVADSHLG